MAAIFFAAVEGSYFTSVPRGLSWEWVSIRCFPVRLGCFRGRETAVGNILTGEASVRSFRVSLFGWRVAVFSTAMGISGLSSILEGSVGELISGGS